MTDDSSIGLWGRVRARPMLWGGIAAALVAGAVVVLVWFQPQTLLFDRVVDDPFPVAGPGDGAPGAADAPDPDAAEPAEAEPTEAEEPPTAGEPATPRATATGAFASRNRYTVTGTATVYEGADGSRTLRLEDFESTNGPDLFVYLTAANSADGDPELDADFVDLGVLRGNVGNQNYDIPADVDLERYDTAVIWCRRFSVGFGAADLAPAG